MSETERTTGSGSSMVKTEEQRRASAKNLEKLETTLDEGKKQAHSNLVLDFDESLTEYRKLETKSPLKVKFEGKVFDVPRSPSADFVFFYLRNCVEKTDAGARLLQIPDDLLDEFFRKMLGAEFTEAIYSSRAPMPFVLGVIVSGVLEAWGLGLQAEEAGDSKKE